MQYLIDATILSIALYVGWLMIRDEIHDIKSTYSEWKRWN